VGGGLMGKFLLILPFLLVSCSISNHAVKPSSEFQSRDQDIKVIEEYQKAVCGPGKNQDLFKVIKELNKFIFAKRPVALLLVSKVEVQRKKATDKMSNYSNMPEYVYGEKLKKAFDFFPSFKILDRSKLDEIMKEKKLAYSGITKKDYSELGALTNATHIMFIDFVIDVSEVESEVDKQKVLLLEKVKLVETETGEIITLYSRFLNGNELEAEFSNIKGRR
jgi:hypothetical protein